MADNFVSGTVTFASDDIASVHTPRAKMTWGVDGVATDVSATDPMPVAPKADPAAFFPGYLAPTTTGPQPLNVDDYGALVTRGAVTTDEGTFRVNFANTSLAVNIGTVTVSGRTVTGTGFAGFTDVHAKDYFKLDADGESAWVQIDSVDSDTQITLKSAYVGSAIGAASRALIRPATGAGGTIAVASGQCNMTSGTTVAAITRIVRNVDIAPMVFRARASVSQRIANQIVRIGLSESLTVNDRWLARFRLEGVTNTTVICESGRNPTTTPSAAETESTTVTLPNGATTAALNEYRVEMLSERVVFYVNGVVVATHTRCIPSQSDTLEASVTIVNGGTAPASSTTVATDYITCKNHNKIEVGVMSDVEQITTAAMPLQQFTFTQAGVIAINTDLIVLDCLQLRSLFIQCTSMGTAGVVTVQWANDAAFTAPITATLVSEAGATSTTFNGAVLRATNVLARYCRLRLTTATTAGTTTINVWGAQTTYTPIVTTQPISGSVTASGTVTATVTGGTTLPVTPTQTFTNSAATTNATSTKASAGTVWSVVATNTNAAARFLKLYNLAAAPTVGTSVPALTLAIPAGGVLQIDGGSNGIRFGTGISWALTTLGTDADATAVAAGEIKVAIAYT